MHPGTPASGQLRLHSGTQGSLRIVIEIAHEFPCRCFAGSADVGGRRWLAMSANHVERASRCLAGSTVARRRPDGETIAAGFPQELNRRPLPSWSRPVPTLDTQRGQCPIATHSPLSERCGRQRQRGNRHQPPGLGPPRVPTHRRKAARTVRRSRTRQTCITANSSRIFTRDGDRFPARRRHHQASLSTFIYPVLPTVSRFRPNTLF